MYLNWKTSWATQLGKGFRDFYESQRFIKQKRIFYCIILCLENLQTNFNYMLFWRSLLKGPTPFTLFIRRSEMLAITNCKSRGKSRVEKPELLCHQNRYAKRQYPHFYQYIVTSLPRTTSALTLGKDWSRLLKRRACFKQWPSPPLKNEVKYLLT
jgi:hypothetical protein